MITAFKAKMETRNQPLSGKAPGSYIIKTLVASASSPMGHRGKLSGGGGESWVSSNELEGQNESVMVYQFSNSDVHWNPLELCKSRGQGPLGTGLGSCTF